MRQSEDRSRVPKYVLLKDEVLRLIQEKRLKPHDQLPSRSELIRDYDVSEITVRKAIDDLTNEGHVYRVHGKGTFVAEVKPGHLTIAMMAPHLYALSDASHMYDIGFMAPIIHSVQREAVNHNANVLLYLNHDDLLVEKQNLASVLSRQVNGLIILPQSEWYNAGYLQQLMRRGTPVASVDRVMRGVDVDSVTVDNETGAYLATRRLIDEGFDRIHYFSSDHDVVAIKRRQVGYVRAMVERGLPYEDFMHVFHAELGMTHEENASHSKAKAVLRAAEPGIAIFAANTPSFVGVLSALNELGLTTDDLGLACFDEPPVYVPDNIIYVKVLQPLEDMGTKAVQFIMDRLHGDVTDPQHVMLQPRLRVSRSGVVEEVSAAALEPEDSDLTIGGRVDNH